MTEKGIETVLEKLRQRVITTGAKLKTFDDQKTQFKQKQLFYSNQKKFYDKIDRKTRAKGVCPDAEGSKTFWSNMGKTSQS